MLLHRVDPIFQEKFGETFFKSFCWFFSKHFLSICFCLILISFVENLSEFANVVEDLWLFLSGHLVICEYLEILKFEIIDVDLGEWWPCRRGKTFNVTYSISAFSEKAKQENYFPYMGLREYWCCISPILQPALHTVEVVEFFCLLDFTWNWFSMRIKTFKIFNSVNYFKQIYTYHQNWFHVKSDRHENS